MRKFLFVVGIAILAAPLYGPVFGQDDFQSIDINSILNQGGNNRNNNRGPQIPDSKLLFNEIQDILKKGKTPLESAQKKPLQNLLDTEVVALTDKLQVMRTNNGYSNNNNTTNATTTNKTAANTTPAAKNQPAPPSEKDIKVDTITSLKNDDFLSTKIAFFLTPEQVALVQKAHADDKTNATCLGGLLDRYYNHLQNPSSGRGNSNNNNYNNGRGGFNNSNSNSNSNNNNSNNNSKDAVKPTNGQKYCMTQDATEADRLEPIRKVLAKGNMPLASEKYSLAETIMKAQLGDLEAALKTALTSNNNNSSNNNNFNGRGGNNNNNRNNFEQVIRSTTDNMYKKVEAMLNPMQADTIQRWHYTQMLSRTPIDALIAVNAMQDTPLSEEQITKVTAAWPELRKEIEKKAKDAKTQITEKQRDGAAMQKILEMIEPEQVASYQLAKKYGPEAVAGK